MDVILKHKTLKLLKNLKLYTFTIKDNSCININMYYLTVCGLLMNGFVDIFILRLCWASKTTFMKL